MFIVSGVDFNAEGLHLSISTSLSISSSFFISKIYVRDGSVERKKTKEMKKG
jgi:hypothetical protein